jgi:pilus assembly protein Flp/PilA
MLHYMLAVRNHKRNDEGATAVEYGLMVAAIAAIIVLLVFAIGKFVRKGFKDTCTGIKAHASSTIAGSASCN